MNTFHCSTCPQLKGKLHKEKIGFLKENGICFGCLKPGHMSKDCDRRLSCKVCNQNHPTVLHIGKVDKERGIVQGTGENATSGAKVSACGQVGAGGHIGGHFGAGEEEYALAIVPVKVKSSKGKKIYPYICIPRPWQHGHILHRQTYASIEHQMKRDQHPASHHGPRKDSKQSYCPGSGGE